MLQVILCEHFVAGSFCIASERDVLLGNMSRSTPDLYIGPVRLERAGQRILALAIIVIIIVVALVTATAAPAILMSLPHGLPFSILMDPRSEPQLASRTATARSMASDLPARRTLPRNASAPRPQRTSRRSARADQHATKLFSDLVTSVDSRSARWRAAHTATGAGSRPAAPSSNTPSTCWSTVCFTISMRSELAAIAQPPRLLRARQSAVTELYLVPCRNPIPFVSRVTSVS